MLTPFFTVFRSVLRIAACMLLVICAWTAILHLIPYPHETGFEALVPNVRCDPPCVMGIQPGITTSTEATHLLNAHPMVNSLRHNRHIDETGEILWDWQYRYEDLKPVGVNVIWHEEDGIIAGISIPTTVSLLEYRIRLGTPKEVRIERYPSSGDIMVREYHEGVYLTYSYRCLPNHTPRPHKQPVTILIDPGNVNVHFNGETISRHILYTNPCSSQ